MSKRQRAADDADIIALPEDVWTYILTFVDVYEWSITMTRLRPPPWLRTATKRAIRQMTTLVLDVPRRAGSRYALRTGALLQLCVPSKITRFMLNCNAIDMALLKGILRRCPNITDVDLQSTSDKLDDRVFDELVRVSNLQRLAVQGRCIDRTAVCDALAARRDGNLRQLSLFAESGELTWRHWNGLSKLTSLSGAMTYGELFSVLPLLSAQRLQELKVTVTLRGDEVAPACYNITAVLANLVSLQLDLHAGAPIPVNRLTPLLPLTRLRHISLCSLMGFAGDIRACVLGFWSKWPLLESFEIADGMVHADADFLQKSMSLVPRLQEFRMQSPPKHSVDLALWTRWYRRHPRMRVLPKMCGNLVGDTLHEVDWNVWFGLYSPAGALHRYRVRVAVDRVVAASVFSAMLLFTHVRNTMMWSSPLNVDGAFVRSFRRASAPCTLVVACQDIQLTSEDWDQGASGQHDVVVLWDSRHKELVKPSFAVAMLQLIEICASAAPRLPTAELAHRHVFDDDSVECTVEDDSFGLPSTKLHVQLRGAWFGRVCQIKASIVVTSTIVAIRNI